MVGYLLTLCVSARLVGWLQKGFVLTCQVGGYPLVSVVACLG